MHTDLVHPKFMSEIVLRKVRRAKNSFEVFWLSHGSSTRIRSTIQYIQKMCFVLLATDGERWFLCRWPSLYKIINYRNKTSILTKLPVFPRQISSNILQIQVHYFFYSKQSLGTQKKICCIVPLIPFLLWN